MAQSMLLSILFAFLLDSSTAVIPSAKLSPQQEQYLANALLASTRASQHAEEELLSAFHQPSFRLGLLWQGDWKLAMSPATEIVAQLKRYLHSVEYTSNFGVDPAWRKAHPGEPAMGFDTIEKYGAIPNMWHLRAVNSLLVSGTPMAQWQIMEAAERDLYGLPLTSKPLPLGPDVIEALERPQYLGVNTRKVTTGISRYGAYTAVLRNDVVRERAVMVGSDSGGWEASCNDGLPGKKWQLAGKDLLCCNGMYIGGDPSKNKTQVGTAEHLLHTLLASTEIFGKVGGHLSRLVYQMLNPTAMHRPIEELMYLEAALLGPLRPLDMKLIVASFPTVFGSRDAFVLRAFCLVHRIPLVWALNKGETWMDESQSKMKFMPFAPVEWTITNRMLDPLSWLVTNTTMPLPSKTEWDQVFKEVEMMRNNTAEEFESVPGSADHFKAWWSRLAMITGTVHPLRGGECESPDLCFGTYTTRLGVKDCLCKKNITQTEAAAPPSDVQVGTSPDVNVLVL